jgi:predicted porin
MVAYYNLSDRRRTLKTFLLSATLITFALTAGAAVAAEVGGGEPVKIEWLKSIDQAMELAESQNKPILLDVFLPT